MVEGTLFVQRTWWWSGLSVPDDGVGVIAHTGSIPLQMVAVRTGLVQQPSKAMAPRSFVPVRDHGQVLADVAVMLVGGGVAVSEIELGRARALPSAASMKSWILAGTGVPWGSLRKHLGAAVPIEDSSKSAVTRR